MENIKQIKIILNILKRNVINYIYNYYFLILFTFQINFFTLIQVQNTKTEIKMNTQNKM